MKLRDYQEKAIEEIRNYYMSGVKKILLHLPTGAGKTKTFCEMLRQAHEKKTPSIMVVHMDQLVRQAEDRLTQDGVPHGVIQGSRTRDEFETVRICSIQTLYRRQFAPPAKFVVIDEAHATKNPQYEWLIEKYKDAFILAVTATPYLKKGMRHVADAVVRPIGTKDLIERGYLVRGKYYSVPNKPDLSDIKIVQGDYQNRELGNKMSELVGDVVVHYRKFANDLPALMFAVNVAHSKKLTDTFNSAGIACKHIDANTPFDKRKSIIQELANGEIKIISSVGTLTTGFDCPPARALIVCRPTRSYNLHIQILGRGSRPYEGKDHFIVLDHAGNTLVHGFYESDRDCNLDGTQSSRQGNADAFLTECENCFAIFHMSNEKCPDCGHVNNKKPKKDIKHKDGELVEINQVHYQKRLEFFIAEAKSKGYKKGTIFHKMKHVFGPEIAEEAWEKVKRMRTWPTRETHPELFETLGRTHD